MATEIERKFLVISDDWRAAAEPGVHFRQGYLASTGRASVRVRLEGQEANLNIKSATLGVRRSEFEYAIPLDDANEMLDQLCTGGLVEKTRYRVPVDGHVWEVDVFEGVNAGLVVAEIELNHEDEVFERPTWAGAEVSDDPRYYNVYLAEHPYTNW
ncbi:MAG: CYTH domain-containing protein [Gammaproteobacteria bacterium]|nr:CYTH domain-containing protein [Gammaproteobacteria bacterium]